MDYKKIFQILSFTLTTLAFSILSFLARNFLINNCNNYDFKIFSIDYIKNYGAAFSLFHTHTSLLICVSSVILLLVLFYIYRYISEFSKSDIFFSALLCSGIVCNLFERIIDGFVTDYIRLNIIVFPIFNISDLFICIGAFVLICNILFSNESQQK